ncbi:universal stress protein [Candidatus Poribacteria bacterium]|nr:universal stress protein [Candidatus Poribacteria bacterium]
MISKLLIAVNKSDYKVAIFNYAIEIATIFPVEIKAIFIVNQMIQNEIFYSTIDIPSNEFIPAFLPFDELNNRMEEDGKKILDELDVLGQGKNIKIEKAVMNGFVDEVICEESKAADLTIIGKYSNSSGRLIGLLGSNTERIMARIEKPIFLASSKYQPIKRILICYDNSPRSKIGLKLACEFKKRTDCSLCIVTVKEQNENAEMIINEAMDITRKENVKVEILSLIGDATENILSLATHDKFDLVVMGAHGHRKIKEFILGTTSYHVARKTDCPVILAR